MILGFNSFFIAQAALKMTLKAAHWLRNIGLDPVEMLSKIQMEITVLCFIQSGGFRFESFVEFRWNYLEYISTNIENI